MEVKLNNMKKFFSFMFKPQVMNIKRAVSIPLIFLILFFTFSVFVKFASAQILPIPLPTMEVVSVPVTTQTVKLTFWETVSTAIQKAGSIAFNRTLSTILNKIAYDAANYIGSGGQGQSPLFLKQNLGEILTNVADEAAGQFIETFVNNWNTDVNTACSDKLGSCRDSCSSSYDDATAYTNCITACDKAATSCASKTPNSNTNGKLTPSFNVCSPSSLEAKLKIGLGLVDQNRPQGPNCTLSTLIKNWDTDLTRKWNNLKDPDYLKIFTGIFDPRANDLMTYSLAVGDLEIAKGTNKDVAESDFITNKGWLDVRDISGAIQGVPGEAQREADAAVKARQEALGKTTGDILVDAANLFLNQLYISSLNNLMQNLGKKTSNSGSGSTPPNEDPRSGGGETALKEVTTSLLQPKFGSLTNYDVVSSLAICLDPNNPAPDHCVIDDKFMQGISEQKTVAEAVASGYLHGDWQITNENKGTSYNVNYSARNISILRKYRILPVGWEQAAKLIADGVAYKATLNDLISCFDQSDQYTQFSSDFANQSHIWCQGLVDPNWVLKAPLNYCAKSGVSAQVLSKTVTSAAGNGELNLVRAEDYCADNQTCIKERPGGGCEVYGYCNEERRIWNFGTDSCQAIDNTCEAFTDTNGKSVAYLKNTLDYANCNADNSGCKQYSLNATYSTTTGTTIWDSANSIYLNKNLSSCDSKSEGCTGLLRIKPTWGGNLVMDSDFASGQVNNWPLTDPSLSTTTIVEASVEPGGANGKALKLQVSNMQGIYSDSSNSMLPNNFQVIPGQSYTVSVDVYLTPSVSAATLSIGDSSNIANDGTVDRTSVVNEWQHLSVTRSADNSYNEPSFRLTSFNASNPGVFYVKNLKFEMSGWDTGYTPYASFKFYEKLLPNYLEKTCYVDSGSATKDYDLKANAPSVCSDFARRCNKDDVGCELYASEKENFAVAAKVINSDYCPSECLGYDSYIAKGNYFNITEAENLIPQTAQTCSASVAGCNEFTNLDTLAQGGEQKEYYTTLKQCVKPSVLECGNFYSWEGTGSGPQLKSYILKKDASNEPVVTAADSASCNATIYNKPVNDPGFNPDCQEFYNSDGGVSYHLLPLTITCSDNCHAYRLSEKNIDKSLTPATCTGLDKKWNAATATCNVCLNGGIWDTNQNSCVYQAIPGEGQTCQAADNGCREYNGNDGANVRLAASYDFESGLGNWSSNCTNGISLSTISNHKDGHSLQYDARATCSGNTPLAQVNAGGLVKEGGSYSLKFLAKTTTASNANLQIYLLNKDTGAKAYFNTTGAVTVKSGGDWNIYQANLAALDHSLGGEEVLVINADNSFLIDDIILSEITDRYYLVKNSSQVPDICSFDIFDVYQGPNYNLGCSQYVDRNGIQNNLHKFTQLCSDSAVGCEQMIDTKNSSNPAAISWRDGEMVTACAAGDTSCVSIPGDSAIYAIYDSTKLCTSGNQGCSRLGQAQGGVNLTAWSDVFKNNNPDQYSNILCDSAAAGCEEWTTDSGAFSYFKNPGFAACSYRASQNSNTLGKAWYKIAVKRCDSDSNGTINDAEKYGSICTNDTGCNATKCILDNNDYPCTTTYSKTIGLGGKDNQVPVPDQFVGVCNKAASGCTEYIDPVTKFAVNVVKNPSFSIDAYGYREGWSGTPVDPLAANQQRISLRENTLYSLSTRLNGTGGQVGGISLDFSSDVQPLLNSNSLGDPVTIINLASGKTDAVIFNSLNNNSVLLTGGADKKIVELKELAIDYQLSSNIDKTSCNGLYKFDNGCILFNERGINGASGLSTLSYDAYSSQDAAVATTCNSAISGNCTANTLVKVRPDRVCSKWFDCISYMQDPVTKQKSCYAVGECDRLDDNGTCVNFTETSLDMQRFNVDANKNTTGYSILGQYNLNQMKEVGINVGVNYDFENGAGGGGGTVINDPATTPGTDYPAHGKAYLRVSGQSRTMVGNTGISLGSGRNTYFINYLVNTKNTSVKARVMITDESGTILKDSVTGVELKFDSSASVWTRKINKFILSGPRTIRIYLGSDSTAPSSIYFDDINIEPVLETGAGKYVSRDCRLYPSTDSLTCTSKSNNVISNGLEGYCLAYDPANPGVCLIWYPVDKIGATRDKYSGGYNGIIPLYYCTAANGNFDIVEKRIGYSGGYWNLAGTSQWVCGHEYEDGERDFQGRMENCSSFEYCPATNGGAGCPSDYYGLVSWKSNGEFFGGNSDLHLICLPKKAGLEKFPSLMTIRSKADETNGNLHGDYCGGTEEGKDTTFYEGVALYNGLEGKEKDAMSPPIRVYDYSSNPLPTIVEQLKTLDNSNGGVLADVYRITCNKFQEVVDENGDNKAWVDRVGPSSIYPNSTPKFFVDNSDKWYGGVGATGYNLDKYGRNNADVIFGAAVFPEGFQLASQSSPIPLRNQYSSSSGEEILAGRPYGCEPGIGNGCKLIGYCSNDAKVFCLIGHNNTCASGSCLPLWNPINTLSTTSTPPNYEQILSKLFLKSYAGYSFSGGSYNLTGSYGDYTQKFPFGTTPDSCVGGVRSNSEGLISFCPVYPRISNVNFYFGDKSMAQRQNLSSGETFTIVQKGIYRLEFNSSVNSQQLPLRYIIIDWGDGSRQTVTGEDQHQDPLNPHIFYHYYTRSGNIKISVRIQDNWDYFGNN